MLPLVKALDLFHHAHNGFLSEGYARPRHRILVDPLVVAMQMQRATKVRYTMTPGGYGTYGAHDQRTNRITGLNLAARPFLPGSGNAPRPGYSTLT